MTGGVRLVDHAIGETREAIVRDGRVEALRIVRWSDAGRRAHWGERYVGRVRTVDRRRRGAFIDLGLSEDEGFLRCDGAGAARLGANALALVEGAALEVEVRREGVRGKGPVLSLTGVAAPGAAIGRIGGPESDDASIRTTYEQREAIDVAIEAACARDVQIPGGGKLIIEPTAAMVAIDVDSGARAGPSDPERFALDLNLAAADQCIRQIRLRGLGGLIVIDFVSMRMRPNQIALEGHVRKALAGDPWSAIAAPLSRFGVMEIARGQLQRPLHETLLDIQGAPTPETCALQCLAAMEREAGAARGRVVRGALCAPAHAWLMKDVIAWRAALAGRIGPRWEIVAGAPGGRGWEVSHV